MRTVEEFLAGVTPAKRRRDAERLVARLGPHTTGVGCVYVKDLDAIDLGVLEAIVAESFRTSTAGTYTLRARDGGPRWREGG